MNPTFPALQDFIYLNTPEQGLLSHELVDYRKDLTQRIMHDPLIMMNEREHFISAVRRKVSGFLDSPNATTALVPNFSFAFNALLDGLKQTTSFLLIEGDYPSINWPVEARGFQTYYASLDATLEDNILQAVEKHRPEIFCVSIVQYISGIKIDLEFLKHLKESYPELIIIADATQYIGVEQFRFRESGIDILAASCYKWMHAGNGNGFMCFKEEVIDRIKPSFTHFSTSKNFTNERSSFMGLFEPGHQDLVSFGSLQKAVELIEEKGIQQIQHSIRKLSALAKTEFENRNLLSEEVQNRSIHSSIFNLKASDKTYKTLFDNNVLCCQRGSGIRVGFSYYNTKNELYNFLKIIDAI